MYAALKHSHMLFALISIIGFIVRSIWAFSDSSHLQKKIVKIAPHIIDTLLLLSAIGLMVISAQYPFVSAWVTAKFLGLVVYIILGVLTLKKAKNNQQRAIFFTLALLTIAYIVVVARTKTALPFF